MSKQQKEDTSPSPNSELGTPLGNVKMRKKFFSELGDKDEAATIIQSRKRLFVKKYNFSFTLFISKKVSTTTVGFTNGIVG